MMADFELQNEGTLTLIRPLNENTHEWLGNMVEEGAQWFGGALVVEDRYVQDLVLGMLDAGFTFTGV